MDSEYFILPIIAEILQLAVRSRITAVNEHYPDASNSVCGLKSGHQSQFYSSMRTINYPCNRDQALILFAVSFICVFRCEKFGPGDEARSGGVRQANLFWRNRTPIRE